MNPLTPIRMAADTSTMVPILLRVCGRRSSGARRSPACATTPTVGVVDSNIAGNGAAPECTRPSNFHPKSIRSRNSQTCIFIANTALSVPPASEPTLTNSNVIITATNVVTFLLFWVPNTTDQAEIAQELDVISVAEGVETREQLDFLRSKSCDIAQGYFFSRPIPKQEFLTWLEAYQANAKSSYSGRF